MNHEHPLLSSSSGAHLPLCHLDDDAPNRVNRSRVVKGDFTSKGGVTVYSALMSLRIFILGKAVKVIGQNE